MHRRPATDSTEDSVSSSSSPNNPTGADGWQPVLQAAATVADAADAAGVNTAAAARISMGMATKVAQPVRPVGQQPSQQQLTLQRHPHRRSGTAALRRTVGRRPLAPGLLDLGPSDESAEDADDEADDLTEEEIAAAAAAAVAATTAGQVENAIRGNADENEDPFEDAHTGEATADENIEVDEAEVDEEDLRSSEEEPVTQGAVPRPWLATNDDFVEFSVSLPVRTAAAVGIAGLGGAAWYERIFGRRDAWRLFHLRHQAAAGCSHRRAHWRPPPTQRRQRRRSLPLEAFAAASTTLASPSLAGEAGTASDSAVPPASAPADPCDDVIRFSPEVFNRLLRETAIGQ